MTVTRVPPTEPAGPTRPAKIEVTVSPQSVAKLLAVIAFVVLVVAARSALLSIALSIVLVLGLDPPVSALERRGWGRGKAGLTVFAAIGLTVVVIVVWAVSPV